MSLRPRLHDFLKHIVAASERIREFTATMTFDDFIADTRARKIAVIRNFEVIGEASRRILELDPDFVDAHPDLPLRQAYRMRNALAHGYFSVNLAVVWTTIESDLSTLSDPCAS